MCAVAVTPPCDLPRRSYCIWLRVKFMPAPNELLNSSEAISLLNSYWWHLIRWYRSFNSNICWHRVFVCVCLCFYLLIINIRSKHTYTWGVNICACPQNTKNSVNKTCSSFHTYKRANCCLLRAVWAGAGRYLVLDACFFVFLSSIYHCA